jgi:hypothetical protein
MSEITGVRCGTCGSEVRAGAKFCTACGNSTDAVAAEEGPRCARCGAGLGPSQSFCANCGMAVDAPRGAGPEDTGDAVVAALESIAAPFGPVVLVERPGAKRSRRCELVTDGNGRIADLDQDRLVPLLEETLIWDGFLCAGVRDRGLCVWHVVNGETFGLGADHAATVLAYLEALRPVPWSESDPVAAAPELEVL